MRKHFRDRHPNDLVIIPEEGSEPFPQCDRCGLQVSPHAVRMGHLGSAMCLQGQQLRRRRRAARLAHEARSVTFTVNGVQLRKVDQFKYLGRPLSFRDSDMPAMYKNLGKARKMWAKLAKLLRRKVGMKPRICGMFYQAVAQQILLYGLESWVVTPAMLSILDGYHHWVCRRISGLLPPFIPSEDRWEKQPPAWRAMRKSGLFPIEEYIFRRRKTVARTATTRPVFDLCVASERQDGSPARKTWWWTQRLEGDDESEFESTDEDDEDESSVD